MGFSEGFYGRLTNRYSNIFLILTGLVVWLHHERTRFRPGSSARAQTLFLEEFFFEDADGSDAVVLPEEEEELTVFNKYQLPQDELFELS